MASTSFFSWGPTYDVMIRQAEKELLESIEWGDSSYTTIDVPIKVGDESHHIHTIVASHPTPDQKLDGATFPIVLWHGFAQGAGSWWRCLPDLAKNHALQVI
jgi:hypothetical protein